MTRATRLVLASQVALALGGALCVALHPGLVLRHDESGMSNYGVHLETVVPYSVALGGEALGEWRAAAALAARARGLRRVLRVLAALAAAALVSTYPYHLDLALNRLHVVVGSLGALVEGALAPWLWRAGPRRGPDAPLALVAPAGCVLGALSLANVVHGLLVAQVLVSAGVGVALVRATAHQDLPEPQGPESASR